jgi:hypothetical protein
VRPVLQLLKTPPKKKKRKVKKKGEKKKTLQKGTKKKKKKKKKTFPDAPGPRSEPGELHRGGTSAAWRSCPGSSGDWSPPRNCVESARHG